MLNLPLFKIFIATWNNSEYEHVKHFTEIVFIQGKYGRSYINFHQIIYLNKWQNFLSSHVHIVHILSVILVKRHVLVWKMPGMLFCKWLQILIKWPVLSFGITVSIPWVSTYSESSNWPLKLLSLKQLVTFCERGTVRQGYFQWQIFQVNLNCLRHVIKNGIWHHHERAETLH